MLLTLPLSPSNYLAVVLPSTEVVSGTQSKWCTGLTVLRAIYILVAVYMLIKDLSDRKSTPRHNWLGQLVYYIYVMCVKYSTGFRCQVPEQLWEMINDGWWTINDEMNDEKADGLPLELQLCRKVTKSINLTNNIFTVILDIQRLKWSTNYYEWRLPWMHINNKQWSNS